jgi:protein SCO1
MNTSFTRSLLHLLLLSSFLFSTALIMGCEEQKFNALDITGATYGKDFSLRDSTGKIRRLADFKGKVVMLYFGFTQCPDICPTALSRAIEIKQRLGKNADQFKVIFITVDPERDSPELLKNYMEAFDPDFLGLYGDLNETKKTAEHFRVYYQKVPTGQSYTMDHTATSYIFDPQGHLRLAVQHNQTAEQITADILKLLQPLK